MANIVDTGDAFKYLLFDARRATFKTWIFDKKAGANCSSDNLAKAGFIKTDKDATCCVFCDKELVWDDPADDPLKEHEDHSAGCPFLPIMRIPEQEWKADDEALAEVLATLAAMAHIKTLRTYQGECDIAYKKAESKLIPYLPSESK
uniref:Baculoviral IAP repeat-containing protein 5.1 n=1 Tax=Panagrellus redivivus TaxID=6233 RepID=A0A7E4USH8_PANRE